MLGGWYSLQGVPRGEQDFQSNRVLLFSYALFLLSCHCLKLALPFSDCISSVHLPNQFLPYIHSCRKPESFALVTVLLLAAHHHQNCHYCSFFLAWNEGGTFPQSITEREQGQKGKLCSQWEIKWFEHSRGIQTASWLYDPVLTVPLTMILSFLGTCLWCQISKAEPDSLLSSWQCSLPTLVDGNSSAPVTLSKIFQ